jgi:hypothetical protein
MHPNQQEIYSKISQITVNNYSQTKDTDITKPDTKTTTLNDIGINKNIHNFTSMAEEVMGDSVFKFKCVRWVH